MTDMTPAGGEEGAYILSCDTSEMSALNWSGVSVSTSGLSPSFAN